MSMNPRAVPVILDQTSRTRKYFLLETAALSAIIIAFCLLCILSLRQKSVTFDETVHLPAGLSYLRTGDFRLEAYNSPLIRMIAALPLYERDDIKLPLDQPSWKNRDHWKFGQDFMSENAETYHRLFFRARLMIVAMGALTILLVFWWTRKLRGRNSAFLCAVLLAFDPNFMAHSRLVTADVGATLFFVIAVIAFWSYCQRESPTRAALSGIALGLAILSKFSSAVLVVILPLLATVHFHRELKTRWPKLVQNLGIIFLCCWITVCTFFKWEGTGRPLGGYSFESNSFNHLQTALPSWLPAPLPKPMIEGMDLTSWHNEQELKNYLFGEIYDSGKPFYFLVALAVKTPLTSLALIAFGMVTLFTRSPLKWKDEWFMALPPLILIAFVSFTSNYNIGLRYILPAFPFLFMIGSHPLSRFKRARLIRAGIGVLLAGTIVSNLMIYPHYLAYFNRAAGGPEKGSRILADSNLDWGQDLIGLKRYLDDQGIDHICLVYFGRVDPAIYGIDHEVPEDPEECETLAVSVQFILGFDYTIISDREEYDYLPGYFTYLKDRKPEAVIGHTIRVFKRNSR